MSRAFHQFEPPDSDYARTGDALYSGRLWRGADAGRQRQPRPISIRFLMLTAALDAPALNQPDGCETAIEKRVMYLHMMWPRMSTLIQPECVLQGYDPWPAPPGRTRGSTERSMLTARRARNLHGADTQLLAAVAAQAATAVERHARMNAPNARGWRARLRALMPEHISEELVENRRSSSRRNQQARPVLFCDVRGFAKLSPAPAPKPSSIS